MSQISFSNCFNQISSFAPSNWVKSAYEVVRDLVIRVAKTIFTFLDSFSSTSKRESGIGQAIPQEIQSNSETQPRALRLTRRPASPVAASESKVQPGSQDVSVFAVQAGAGSASGELRQEIKLRMKEKIQEVAEGRERDSRNFRHTFH